jgi:hypothetical protein
MDDVERLCRTASLLRPARRPLTIMDAAGAHIARRADHPPSIPSVKRASTFVNPQNPAEMLRRKEIRISSQIWPGYASLTIEASSARSCGHAIVTARL